MAEAVDATRQRHLFRLAYGVLALAFWLSIAGFTLLLTRSHQSDAHVAWSQWKPTDSGLLGARQIGHMLAPRYRAADGTELAVVQEHLPEVQGLHLETIGVRRLTQSGRVDPFVRLFDTGGTLIYAFCGLHGNCSIEGKETVAQERLLRREALELSLYAFKYLKGVDQVVSLVHPLKSGLTSAVFLRKRDLGPELGHPLHATLPLAAAPPAGAGDRSEAAAIDALTLTNTFVAHVEPLPDGDGILVLDVPVSGGS